MNGTTSSNLTLDGEGGDNVIWYGTGGAATWNITGNLSGNLSGGYAFTNIDEIQGSIIGNDLFQIYEGATVPTLNGRGGTNTLDATNVTSAVNWSVTGADSGQVVLTTPSTSNFINIQNLVGTPSAVDTFDLTGGSISNISSAAGNNVYNMNGTNVTLITGGTGADSFNVNAGTIATINGTAGANTYNLNGGTITTLTGGTAQDTFNLFPGITITNPINGNGGTNILVGPNTANIWNITNNNEGNIDGISFTDINYLTGNANNDEFIFANGKGITGAIDGGAGDTNTLDYSNYTSAVTINLQETSATNIKFGLAGGFSNIDTFVGGSTSSDNIIASNANNTWNITLNNAGDIGGSTFFRSFENLSGGTLNDDFVFSDGRSVTGTVDGVAGSNSIDYSAYTTPVTVNLQTGSATGTGGFSNIGTFIGADSANDVITGPNAVTVWNITSNNAGNIGGVVSFSQFKNVTGGAADDSFVFTDGVLITGVVDGGSGTTNDVDFTNWTDSPISVDVSIATDYLNIQKVKVIAEIGGSVKGTGLTILEGHPTSGTWNVTGGNLGTYGNLGQVTFSDIATLEGTSTDDRFLFAALGSVSGLIIGGSGTLNELDYSSYGAPIYVNFETGVATATNGFLQIQKVTGSGSFGDTLVAPNSNNTWQITGNNEGNINSGSITFSSIENLTGGSLNDTFVFADQIGVSGIIDGGSSSPYVNTLDYSAYTTPVHVDLDGGEATGTGGITRIQNFILPSGYPIPIQDLIRLYVTEISLASDLRDDNETYYYFSWPIRIWRIEENLNEVTPIYFYEFFRRDLRDKNLLMR
jgi:hypothetical protein